MTDSEGIYVYIFIYINYASLSVILVLSPKSVADRRERKTDVMWGSQDSWKQQGRVGTQEGALEPMLVSHVLWASRSDEGVGGRSWPHLSSCHLFQALAKLQRKTQQKLEKL